MSTGSAGRPVWSRRMPPSYSKAKVDAAGRMLADYVFQPEADPEARPVDPAEAPALLSASEIVDWWRREHAYP